MQKLVLYYSTFNSECVPCVQVMEGGGRMVVTAVGPNSQQGIIFQLLTQREDDAGFIEKFFRDKVFKYCRRKPVVDEEVPRAGSPDEKTKAEEVEEEELPPIPPLTGWDRFSIEKRMKRRKEVSMDFIWIKNRVCCRFDVFQVDKIFSCQIVCFSSSLI